MIKSIQIDINGICNAKCWFCPVAYLGNPTKNKNNMSPDMLDNILKQINDGIGDFVDPKIKESSLVSLAQFNEPLLYPFFNDLLNIFQKYGFGIVVFSNGINLTKERVDLLKKYPDVVKHICLNIPSAFPEQWSKFTGFNIKLFDKLLSNIKYAEENFSNLLENNKAALNIQVNGIKNKSLSVNGGLIDILKNSIELNIDDIDGDIEKTKKEFNKMFPKIPVFEDIEIVDRNGILENIGIFTNIHGINNNIKKNKNKVIGCKDRRAENAIHISANGDFFFCYNDFNLDTIFGNIKNKTIKEIWQSKERKEMIKKCFSNFCTKCTNAIWE